MRCDAMLCPDALRCSSFGAAVADDDDANDVYTCVLCVFRFDRASANFNISIFFFPTDKNSRKHNAQPPEWAEEESGRLEVLLLHIHIYTHTTESSHCTERYNVCVSKQAIERGDGR